MKKVIRFFKDIYIAYIKHQLPFLAAAVSFFFFLSLFNLLFFISGVIGFFVRDPRARKLILDYLVTNFPLFSPFAEQNLEALASLRYHLGIIGFFLLIYSAIGIFATLNQALDNVYEVRPKSTYMQTAKGILVMLLIFLFLIISVGLSYLASYGERIFAFLSVNISGTQVLTTIISYAFLFFTILLIYRYLIDVNIGTKEVLPGTIFTVIVWKIFETLYKAYIDNFLRAPQIFGISAFVIATLTWLYVSALIVFIGAELNVYLGKIKTKKEKRKTTK